MYGGRHAIGVFPLLCCLALVLITHHKFLCKPLLMHYTDCAFTLIISCNGMCCKHVLWPCLYSLSCGFAGQNTGGKMYLLTADAEQQQAVSSSAA